MCITSATGLCDYSMTLKTFTWALLHRCVLCLYYCSGMDPSGIHTHRLVHTLPHGINLRRTYTNDMNVIHGVVETNNTRQNTTQPTAPTSCRVSRGCSSEKHSSSVVAAVCCKRCTLPCTFSSTCLIRRNRTATTRIAPPTTAVPVVSHSHAEKRSVNIPIIFTLICRL